MELLSSPPIEWIGRNALFTTNRAQTPKIAKVRNRTQEVALQGSLNKSSGFPQNNQCLGTGLDGQNKKRSDPLEAF